MDAIKRFAERFPDGVDAVLIQSGTNRFYFTGFSSSAGTLFMTKDKAWFIIDFRYIESAQKQISNCTVILEDNLTNQLKEIIKENNIRTVGLETGYTNVLSMQNIQKMVAPAELLLDSDVNEAILSLRRMKTPYEIECFAKAQDIADKAFMHILDYIKVGMPELDVMIELGTFMAKNGSQRKSFDFIFTSGVKTSLPHGGGALRNIEDGDFIMMDMGGQVGGYNSDMTRTIGIGNVTQEQKDVYAIVLQAQQKALDIIKPGVVANTVDAAARNYIYESGYRGCFGHGLGHSLGIEIHEMPRFNEQCEMILAPCTMMTVEPGIYLPNKFGVRIEDMIVITEDGYENLTHSPKELIIL